MPEIRNQDRELVWFHFKLSGHRKDTLLTLHLPFQKSAYAPDPLVVKDGMQWIRVPAENHDFYKTYRFRPVSDTLRIATGVPYTYSDLQVLLKELSAHKDTRIHTLCQSENQRMVPLVQIATDEGNSKKTIAFIGRQHAFEAPSGYFMQGVLKELSGSSPEALYLKTQFQFLIVPMMDVDNVVFGAYGKDQLPRDINRDWTDSPHWTVVKSVQELLYKTQKTHPIVASFDCHAPHPITRLYSHYYLTVADSAGPSLRLRKLMSLMAKREGYKLSEQRNNRIKKGEMNFNRFVQEHLTNGKPTFPDLQISTTYEQSWQTKKDGTPYTPEVVEQSGRNLVKSLAEYFGFKQ